MTVSYYLYGKDESKDIEYFLYLAPNIDLGRINDCKKWVERLYEWWEEFGVIPSRLSLSNLSVEVLELIVLFKRLTDACVDFKHFATSIILQWYGGIVVDESAVKKKIPEDVKSVVVLEPDLSLVEVEENPNYKPEQKEPQ